MKIIIIISLVKTFLYCHPVVDYFDVEKFMGRWYVISLIPNWIEEGCTNSYDDYELNEDGTVSITYSALKDGKNRTIKQKGTILEKDNPGKWEIQFVKPWIPFFKAPYEVIILEDNFEYMVVGYPGNKFGWIMSRKTFMDDLLYNEILDELENNFEYDRAKFEKVIHDQN